MRHFILTGLVAVVSAILFTTLAAGRAGAVCGDAVVDPGEQCDDGNLVAGDCCDASCMFETGPGTPPCCNYGICSVAAPCGTACFGTQLYCNYQVPMAGPPAICGCAALPAAPPLEHYRLYLATGKTIGVPVTLRDQFQTETAVAALTGSFMAPTQKNSEGSPDLYGPHLTCYASFPAGEPFAATVRINNQFGPQVLEVGDPNVFCVPTDKHISPGPNPGVLDHFKCYDAVSSFAGAVATLQDQFQTEAGVLVGPPLLFCNPVDKNGEGIQRPLDHLTCYQALGPTTPVPGSVPITNQFGPDTLEVGQALALCVPTIKEDVQLACGSSFPACDGTCPAGSVCGQQGVCLEPGSTPCDPAAPACPFGASCFPVDACICR